MKLGRRFIGADINLGAIQTTTKRLLNVANELTSTLKKKQIYELPSVHNVNQLRCFSATRCKNKRIAYKSTRNSTIPVSSYTMGRKDGRMVKIMPVNRIATRADARQLQISIYKKFEKQRRKSKETNGELYSIGMHGT